MDQKKIVSIAFIALVLLTLFMLFDNAQKKGLNGKSVSPNILYITQPVTSFSGIVDKIEGNRITIKQSQTLVQNIAPPAALAANIPLSPIPTPKTVILTYEVVVSNKTQISQAALSMPYLFKSISPAPAPKLTIKDIKVGTSINVSTQVDLRTLAGTTFEATMINMSQKTTMLNGKISRVDGNVLTIKAFPPTAMNALASPIAMGAPQNAPKEKEYVITLASDTEISRTIYGTAMTAGEAPSTPKTEKLGLSDLKKDMQITVYTDADVTVGTKFNALRIEPMMTAVAPPTPVTSVSATPAP